ncbi:MAG: PTS sugar transporter subunit IIA [Spirochaetaceae bacterium]|jgi:mannitol/fructose-specific phosphotransferase system IIA component (Ntr-type)|nr:PTS sugar transporter subunit IIA [Spirochaetaceae bacterium]
MPLSDIFKRRLIKVGLESKTRNEVFEELVETIIGAYPNFDRRELIEALLFRENRMNTAILPGVAVPHGYCNAIGGIIGAVGFSRAGIEYGCREPVHSVFMLLMDGSSPEHHLRVLSRLLELLKSESFTMLRTARNAQEAYNILYQF